MATKIIFHTSDSSFGNAALITKWHTFPATKTIADGKTYQGRGWDMIGYHYVITNGWLDSGIYHPFFDGNIETGRAIDGDAFVSSRETGAHVFGQNTGSVGVCLIGKSGQHTPKQIQAAYKLLMLLEQQFKTISVHQHSDFDKAKPYCAGLDMKKFLEGYSLYKKSQIW